MQAVSPSDKTRALPRRQVLTIAEQAEARERAASARDPSAAAAAFIGSAPGSPQLSFTQQQQQQHPGSPAQQRRSAPPSPAREPAVAHEPPAPPPAEWEAAARNGDMPSPFADAAAGPGWDATDVDPGGPVVPPLPNGFAAVAAAEAAEQLHRPNGFAAQQVWQTATRSRGKAGLGMR